MKPNFLPTRTKLSIAVFMALFASGCAITSTTQNEAAVEKANSDLQELIKPTKPQSATIHDEHAPLEIAKLPDAIQTDKQREWLRSKKVSYTPKNSVPANEILKLFRQNGINITSVLPLDNFYYNGNGVVGVDGETAIRLILGQMGLDFDVNDKDRYVNVVPMKSRTWIINLGNRKSRSASTSFEDNCPMGSNQNGTGNSGVNGSSSGGGGSGTSTSTNSNTSAQGQQSSTTGNGENGQSNVETTNTFWTTLRTELEGRLTVLVPSGSNGPTGPTTPVAGGSFAQPPMLVTANAGASSGSGSAGMRGDYSMYKPVIMGNPVINPDTGAVTIQAPTWMLKQIDAYMEGVLQQFNTSMTFQGMVVNVRSSSDRSEGFDLAALGKFAGKYGIVLNNNILGGVTLSPTGLPTVSYGASATLPGSGAALGLVSASDNLQIFSAFLKTVGGAKVTSEPLVTVTTGVPAVFGRLTPIYTNEPSQDIAAGNINSNALVTVKNNIIEHRYGSLLRIMPHYDPTTNRVRAQLSLLQKPLTGTQVIPIYIVDNKGVAQPQNIRKPNIECGVISTETILDDGEMIIVGGQVENITDNSHSGTDGLMDIKVVDWFTSQKRETSTRVTSYFAIRVSLNKKPTTTNQKW